MQQEVVDLLKFLYLAQADQCNFIHVIHMPQIVNYLNELWACGVGPSGHITKLQTILNTIKMLIVVVLDDRGDEARARAIGIGLQMSSRKNVLFWFSGAPGVLRGGRQSSAP